MGIFSSKTKYYVASQIYNLAGEPSDRPNYLKSLTVQSALTGGSLARNLSLGMINGPGMGLQAFHRWANLNYDMGMPNADIIADEIQNLNPVRNNIPIPSGSPSGTRVQVINAVITKADASFWVEKYLAENRPDLIDTDWVYEQDDVSNVIRVSFVGNRPDIVFNPSNWIGGANYVIARYVLDYPERQEALQTVGTFGPFRTLGACQLDRYSLQSQVNDTPQVLSLNRREVRRTEFTDGTRPSEQAVINTSQPYVHAPLVLTYQWDENVGYLPGTNRPTTIRHTKTIRTVQTKTTEYSREIVQYGNRIEISSIEQEVATNAYTYAYTTRVMYGRELSNHRVFLYRMGSGIPALDRLRVRRSTASEFFPVLPLRIDNRFIDGNPYATAIYPHVKKAYKKAFGQNIDNILDELRDNESINDLDFAFIVFGVTLNERNDSAKLYLYEFLKGLMSYQISSKSEWIAFQNETVEQIRQGQAKDTYDSAMRHKLAVAPPVVAPPQYPVPRRSQFVLDANIPMLDHYDITISWSYIAETLHTGKGKPNAKNGELWFTAGPAQKGSVIPNIGLSPIDHIKNAMQGYTNEVVYLYHQYAPFKYRRLEIVGLHHNNYVYKNKFVGTTAKEAINEVEESSFFIPLHYPTLKKLTFKHQNELAFNSRLLLLNSYQSVKVRWYQRGIFKIIFVAAVIIGSFFILGPMAMAAAPGILGTNIAVGTAIGLAGTAAIIAGAAANMIAGMILTMIISKASVSIFGEKWGQIIGTVVSFFAMQMGANYATTGSFNINWTEMFSPQNLTKLTDAVARGHSGFMQGKMNELYEAHEKDMNNYKDELKLIEDKMNELLGSSAYIDPMLLTELSNNRDVNFNESSGVFLQRTLLTGSDIAELSLSMISEFPTISLELPKAII